MKICSFFEFNNFRNLLLYELVDNGNSMILEIVKFGKFLDFFFNLENQNLTPKIGKFWVSSSLRYFALFVIPPILMFAL